MAETQMAFGVDDGLDDLPRTLRREREARERATSPLARAYAPEPSYPAADLAQPGTVTAFEVPFTRLMAFCVKATFAAIPALILLGAMLWLAGHLLMIYFPWLVKVQILVRVPQ